MDAMYVILEYYSVWFCFTLHKFLHLTLSDHIMNAIRRINDVETNKLKLKHTIYYFPQKISSWNGNFLQAPAHWLAAIAFWAPRLYKSIHVTFVFWKIWTPPWLCTVNSKIINKLRPDRNWISHRNQYRNHHWNPVGLTGSVTGTGTGTRLCHWYLSRKCAIKVTLE